MKCKFLEHGLVVGYGGVVKPCCAWNNYDRKGLPSYKETNLADYHKNSVIVESIQLLEKEIWPLSCKGCERMEKDGKTSMRQNGNSSYANLNKGDIVLEIRPGNTCNLACHTCWPGASSRVDRYLKQAGLIESIPPVERIDDFTFLDCIKDKIKKVILLGGEPFYDKNCLKFLGYAKENLKAEITIFTNGKMIPFDLLQNSESNYKIVFSIDGIGKGLEWLRFGANWESIKNNFIALKDIKGIQRKVNITMSALNLFMINELISWLIKNCPEYITIGQATESYFHENVIPTEMREQAVEWLTQASLTVVKSKISLDQKQNLVKNFKNIIKNLKHSEHDTTNHIYLIDYMKKLHVVKKINTEQLDPYIKKLLKI